MTEDTFELKPWNDRPAPLFKVTGFGDMPDGPLVFLACGHSLPWEQTDDIPLKGSFVACERCIVNPPKVGLSLWGRGVA